MNKLDLDPVLRRPLPGKEVTDVDWELVQNPNRAPVRNCRGKIIFDKQTLSNSST